MGVNSHMAASRVNKNWCFLMKSLHSIKVFIQNKRTKAIRKYIAEIASVDWTISMAFIYLLFRYFDNHDARFATTLSRANSLVKAIVLNKLP